MVPHMVFILLCLLKTVVTLTMKLQAAHNSNTTLYCNYPHFKMPVTPWQIYWILPNETVIQPRFAGDSKFHVGRPPAYNLTVMNLNHKDFGWFYCVILWDNWNYFVDSVKVGLNVDGAVYDELYEEYKAKVITGSIAAGSVFVILCLSCAIWHYRCGDEGIKAEEKTETYDFDQVIKSFDKVIDANESNTETVQNDEDIAEYRSAEDIHSVDDKVNDEVNEAGGYALVMRNRAYIPDGQEDVQISTIVMENLYDQNSDDTMIAATPF